MAEGFGNVVGHWQAYVRAWVYSETDTTATVICECYFNPRGWGFYVNGYGSAAISGQDGKTQYTTFNRPSGSWTEQWVANKMLTINKTGSVQNITCGAYVRVTGGYENGQSWASCTVRVGARTYTKHGAPWLKVSSLNVGVGEKIKLTWGRASNQGNARFDHFEIWENHKKIYSGGGTSLEVIPANATPLSDNPDNVYYEVSEVHEWYGTYPYTLADKWVGVTRLAKPGMPRLLSPQNGETVQSDSSTTLQWVHTSRDKTAQESAIVEYTANYNSEADTQQTTTLTITGAKQSTTVTAPSFDVDSQTSNVSRWRVKTKGKHAEYSDWSDYYTFYSCPEPTVEFTCSDEIEQFPFNITWNFSDWGSNTQIAWELEVGEGVGAKIMRGYTSSSSFELQGTEREYTNNEVVPIKLTVTSSSGMKKTVSKDITIKFTPPAKPQLAITANEDNLSMNLTALAGIDSKSAPTYTLDVYRDNVPLAESVHNTDKVVDKLVPLDTILSYTIIAKTVLGTVNSSTKQAYIPSKGRMAINFGENLEKTLVVGLDGKPNLKREREKELFDSASYDAPVAVYGTHSQASGKFEAVIYKDVKNFGTFKKVRELMDWGQNCLIRMPFTGDMFHADVDIEVTEYGSDYARVSIEWKEIAYGTGR